MILRPYICCARWRRGVGKSDLATTCCPSGGDECQLAGLHDSLEEGMLRTFYSPIIRAVRKRSSSWLS
jgi:hypothetical protein